MYNYFKKRAQIEEEYSKSLFKLHQKSFNNPTPSGEEVEAAGISFSEAWNSIEKAAHTEGQAHATYQTIIKKIQK